jgi:AcrR family transcriptional regulator
MTRRGTRDMIVDVAAGLFATAGLRRTTMESIASAAGRGRRTVYMYFRNKAEIYDAVVEMEIRRITAPLKDIVTSEDAVEVLLQRYGEERALRLVDLIRRNPLLMKDFAQGHSRIERLRDKLHKAELQILTPLFAKQVTVTGDSAKGSPEDYASLFIDMLRGHDRQLTKTDGLGEAIRLASLSALIISSAHGISS